MKLQNVQTNKFFPFSPALGFLMGVWIVLRYFEKIEKLKNKFLLGVKKK